MNQLVNQSINDPISQSMNQSISDLISHSINQTNQSPPIKSIQVSRQLQSHADRSPGLQMNIVEARRRLTGQETSDLLRYNDILRISF